ncbi:uncharacterized protein PITG_08595 [Phytophthora infestans T30-4]|uniref:Uncharacterized protein n=1 Tax=Phytophthora infestans (strain T30-4) TaxID=403677 RepID=D0NB04_PHYIT|nr:uncharacterized protein PITG_08595 [Phytophthora infestans T30-4]EEY55012.1 conserved hypothetical protein [Phytophthora infestans T30-4]|eukprot:XP_002903957.1 conserved hypothetical protein [Phytophthora infestans T30-4]
MHKLWEKLNSHVKGHATKAADAWSVERPAESAWSGVMQLKANGRLVPAAKSPELWRFWTAYQRGNTVTLMIYEPVFARSTLTIQVLQAEVSIGEMVTRLQDVWGNTYQGSYSTWIVWANKMQRNLDRSTWDASVLDPPPSRLECYLSPSDGQVHEHLVHLTKSTRVALDTVNIALADNQELKDAWEAYGYRLGSQKRALEARKVDLEGYLGDIPVPAVDDVHDPIQRIENIENIEHQE